MIYTSYFGMIKYLPKDIVPIAICGRPPSAFQGLKYPKLAPKWEFFKQWKETKDNQYYIKEFNQQVLSQLKCSEVINELYSLAEGKDVCLVCYEKPEDFCHRHLVADWIMKNEQIMCKEYVYDTRAKGKIIPSDLLR